MADTSDPHSLNRYSPQEHRLLIVKPGDVLVVGHASELTAATADVIKRALGLAAVIALPAAIDIAAVRHPTADGR